MSTPDITIADQEFKTLVLDIGFPADLVNAPVIDPARPYYIIYPFPYSTPEGGMAGANEIQELVYMVRTVAPSYDQAREAQKRLHAAVDGEWDTMAGVMGPPSVSVGATTREDENTFNSTDLVRMKVSI